MSEAEFKRAIIPQTEQLIVAVDHTKFNKDGVVKVCSLSDIDLLITDKMPPDEIVDHIGANKIKVAS
ncbi:MAG: DeoR/GlpR transcriptional regulator [Sneathiella sp.]|nr:DeoR/GlpR transcriptional regulator [Sneathiella sp.]